MALPVKQKVYKHSILIPLSNIRAMYQRCTLFLVHPHHRPSAASASSPPTHSAGEAPGMDRLIPGAGFLLARRRMRWRAADTCLSAASCVRSSPPLAFFCGVRGTLPESRSVQARSLTGAYLPTLWTNALLSFASLLPNQRPVTYTPQTQKPPR